MNDNKFNVIEFLYFVPLTLMTLFLVYQFYGYIMYAFAIVRYPYEINAGEGLIVARALMLSNGENTYTPIHQAPYLVMNYTPLFELFLTGFVKLFGPKIMIGRLISVLSTVVSGALLARITYNFTGKKLSAVAASMFFIASGWTHNWSVLCRIDMFALMFVLCGLALLSDPEKNTNIKYVIYSALCFLAALFTRQSLIAAPLACIVYFLLPETIKQGCFRSRTVQDKKGPGLSEFVPFVSVCIGVGVLLIVLLTFISKGEFFKHTFTYTFGSYAIDDFIRWTKDYLKVHWVAFGLSCIFIVVSLVLRKISVPLLFWILALVVTLTAGKLGSSINYFIEFWAANCIILGVLIAYIERPDNNSHRNVIFKFVLLGCLISQVYLMNKYVDRSTPLPEYEASSRKLKQLIRETDGEVLSEYAGYLVQNNKKVVFQPFTMTQLATSGVWYQGPLIKDISNQRFDLVVLTGVGVEYDRWTEEIVNAIEENYILTHRLPCFELSFFMSTINTHLVYIKK